eukprot:gene2545-3276_t
MRGARAIARARPCASRAVSAQMQGELAKLAHEPPLCALPPLPRARGICSVSEASSSSATMSRLCPHGGPYADCD